MTGSSVAQHRAFALLAIAVTAACNRTLPPAATPEPIVPAIDTTAPVPEGHGRLVVDVVDGPTPVRRIDLDAQPIDDGTGVTRFRFGERDGLLCAASPCVVDLPAGNLLLGFPVIGSDTIETELVHVEPGAHAYRRTLSIYTERGGSLQTWGILSTSVGGTALLTGAVLLPIGLAEDLDGMTVAGGISLAAGAVLTTFGIWALRKTADLLRPGSANHYPLP